MFAGGLPHDAMHDVLEEVAPLNFSLSIALKMASSPWIGIMSILLTLTMDIQKQINLSLLQVDC